MLFLLSCLLSLVTNTIAGDEGGKKISISIQTSENEDRPYEATFDASDAADPWRLGAGPAAAMNYKLVMKRDREEAPTETVTPTTTTPKKDNAVHAMQGPQTGAWHYFEFIVDKDAAHLAVQLSELRFFLSDASSSDSSAILLGGAPVPPLHTEGSSDTPADGEVPASTHQYQCEFENPHGESPEGETVTNLFDNNLDTKWIDLKFVDNHGSTVRINCSLAAPIPVRSYEVITANDERIRDPSGWTLKGSVDNEKWQILDQRANMHTPLSRQTSYGRFDLLHTGSLDAAHSHDHHHETLAPLQGTGTAESALRAFQSARVIPELIPETVMHLVQHVALPFTIFLLCGCDRDAYFGNVLSDIEDDIIDHGYHERMTFLYLEPTLALRFGILPVFAITPEQLPVMVIDNIPMGSNNEKFKLAPDWSRSLDNIVPEPERVSQFIDDFFAFKLPLIVRSQPAPLSLPAPGSGGVVDVVGNTFQDIVLDPTKAVLLLVYAPWCGGSRAVAPLIDQVARQLRDNPDVRVARIDKTANDFTVRGITVTHYPTVLLFPATTDKQSLDFDDFNGSKQEHNRFVPHSHYSVDLMTKFVLAHIKGLSSEEAEQFRLAKEALATAGHGGHDHAGHSH